MTETALRRPPRTALLDSETRNYEKAHDFEGTIYFNDIDIEQMIKKKIWEIPWQGVHTKGEVEMRKNPFGLPPPTLQSLLRGIPSRNSDGEESGNGGEGDEGEDTTPFPLPL